jgi:hypothetical protein
VLLDDPKTSVADRLVTMACQDTINNTAVRCCLLDNADKMKEQRL